MHNKRVFNDIIKEICQEDNIYYEELSEDWIIKLKKSNKTKFIIGYKFDLNTQAISEICDDKYALYTVLKSEKLPIIEYNILFNNEEEKLKEYFDYYNKNVVLKPNNGTCGNNVFHILDYEILKKEYNNLISKNYSISICPYYEIENEYRVIYLSGKNYIYKKIKPIVIGDGIHNIQELLNEFNYLYFSNKINDKKIDLKYIPFKGENIEYEWRFNLSKGAKIEEVTESEKNDLLNIVKKIIKIIDFKFVSIDIVKIKSNEYKVMEINSGVMTENLIKLHPSGKKIVKEIYKEALNEMFN